MKYPNVWQTRPILLGLLVLAGCGQGIAGIPQDHGVFEIYFQRFETYSRAQGRDTTGDDAVGMEFSSELTPGAVAGRCIPSGPIIQVEPGYWAKTDDTAREMLILHELGHCLLLRAHVLNQESVMFPEIADGYGKFIVDKTAFIKELFSVKGTGFTNGIE